jgi:hypothetical protein
MDDHIERMVRRWRDSHARSDAVALWRAAAGVKVGEYAFTAIVSDRAVLNNLPRNLAEKLARDAEGYIQQVAAMVGHRNPAKSASSAAIYAARQAVARWRNRKATSRLNVDEGLAATVRSDSTAESAADIWKEMLKTHPQFSETTGAMTLAAVVALGAKGLAGVQEPWDGVMALGAARYVARAKRGDLIRPAPTLEAMGNVIAAVQNYAGTTGRSPWNVGYTGRVGSAATQALRLARDAAICCDIAADLPEGPNAGGFQIWTQAEDCHAFSSMTLDPTLVRGLTVEDARRFASAALRHATMLLALPGGIAAIEASGIPAPSVTAAINHAKAIVSDGPLPRPWEAKPVPEVNQGAGPRVIWQQRA